MQQTQNSYYPQPQGLYNASNEHDACGVGMVADINGVKKHSIVDNGVQILERLMHRGAVGGDSQTGDGAGIMVQIPDEFFRAQISGLPKAGEYAVGMIFLPREEDLAQKCRAVVEAAVAEEGMSIIAWRKVPVDESAIGGVALSTCPRIEQVFVSGRGERNEADFERALYILRRVIEKNIDAKTSAGDTFYVCTLSCRTIVYKGLLNAPQLKAFYPDLADKTFKSAIALVHQRYSTNTFPTWQLAQPFRYLAHNGEINTLRGNINQMRSRETHFESPLFGENISKVIPVIRENQSDSACLDNAVELYASAGRSLAHTMLMLVPQAWGKNFYVSKDIAGFFEYNSGVSEPWDGPAALAFTDGTKAGALLDRNGLRPARYTICSDGLFVLASETGVLDIPENLVLRRGKLGAGEMIYLDLEKHRILFDKEIKTLVARAKPYRRWVDDNRITLSGIFESVPDPIVGENLIQRQKLFGYTAEDMDMILRPMAENGQEPNGSMGNDAALAVLSDKAQLLYDYFKQLFAQVTNPPIDPIREQLVMSLMTYIGNQGNTLVELPSHAHLLKLPHPILANRDVNCICTSKVENFQARRILAEFSAAGGAQGLELALDKICAEAEQAVRDGKSVIILSDKNLSYGHAPIPMLLAVAAVNRHLVEKNMRTSAGIVAETGEAREIAHFCLLLGYGATAINPYLAIESIANMVEEGRIKNIDAAGAVANYIKAICKGILKVMSKMGISTLRSYRQAQVFEAVGLGADLVDKYFAPTASRVGGIGLTEIASESLARYHNAHYPKPNFENVLENAGKYKFKKDGEHHLWTPQTITLLQRAVRENDEAKYREYANFINDQSHHLCTLRGLFKFKPTKAIPIEEVEPVESIIRRFVTGAMSFGSISPEAHETIALAMNRLGGMSNCGEGGEDPARYANIGKEGDISSAIKQVASGRFGVTAEYLANAKELQIKVAQGAKPGEGGQLPGYKVNEIIARVRHATAGVTLISPPPHHDIYSIEDLAQLIYDLRNANEQARISVKLVSEVGVGTVAAGVAKAKADVVLISGHDGGTGASPLTSIKYAGLPWELGIAEAQQTLRLNGLRDKIRVQVDGQMKTGRDVVIGALLGAEEFGFATTILVTLGCVMMRKCHDNSCPVGVATQDPRLRKCFKGKPEHIENFLRFLANEVREILASLGLRSIDEAVGRSDLLETNYAIEFWKSKNLDFSKIFEQVGDASLPRRSAGLAPRELAGAYDKKILAQVEPNIQSGEPVEIKMEIRNSDRSVGAMLANHIAKKYGHAGLPADTVKIDFTGVAGQSFGAFLPAGATFILEGEANDYMAKSLSGGTIVVRLPRDSKLDSSSNVIAGNVIGYGATSGKVFVNGKAGERFAIRNSGATFVVEGVGDHCCEYMTGGRVVCLGPTGFNFAAGMTGGFAYVYDELGNFDMRCNLQSVDLESVAEGSADDIELKSLIEDFYISTDSKRAKEILVNWENELPKFVKVFPIEYRKVLGKLVGGDEVKEKHV
ncbi:MAG: glutamate synthase large subunit [Candidatus Merdousia sp.]|nr:glutamate synthase large subunit [Candidatus Merdousia sp.]